MKVLHTPIKDHNPLPFVWKCPQCNSVLLIESEHEIIRPGFHHPPNKYTNFGFTGTAQLDAEKLRNEGKANESDVGCEGHNHNHNHEHHHHLKEDLEKDIILKECPVCHRKKLRIPRDEIKPANESSALYEEGENDDLNFINADDVNLKTFDEEDNSVRLDDKEMSILLKDSIKTMKGEVFDRINHNLDDESMLFAFSTTGDGMVLCLMEADDVKEAIKTGKNPVGEIYLLRGKSILAEFNTDEETN